MSDIKSPPANSPEGFFVSRFHLSIFRYIIYQHRLKMTE
jgi:hypothetical protein